MYSLQRYSWFLRLEYIGNGIKDIIMENLSVKQPTAVKNPKLFGWVFPLLWLPLIGGCEKVEMGCLPYEGEVFALSCNGIVIKVVNTSVDSFMEWGGGREENVIAARIPEGMGFEEFFGFPIEEAKANQRFYFDFRVLRKEEYNICTMEYAGPTRLVYMTEFSLRRCEINDE